MKDKKIYGVVVLYNPNIQEVVSNINSYIKILEKLYIIDNSKKENYMKLKKYMQDKTKIKYIWLRENKGIAKALNIGKKLAVNEEADYLLTMDQDSSFEDNLKEMIEWILENEASMKEVAIVSPFHNIRQGKSKQDIEEKRNVMTSGNLLNLKLIRNIGEFNEDFFIDEVDNEFCYRIREKGYKIMCFNKVVLKHKLGELKDYRYFFVTNHNYIRRYYITRNKCYIIKLFPYLKNEYVKSLFADFFKIIFFEKDKLKKIKYFFKGIQDFYNNKIGKLEEEFR